jgi:hypothetical protein
MRDGNPKLSELSSYSLKTTVMQLKKKKRYLQWNEGNMIQLFLEVIGKRNGIVFKVSLDTQ